MRDAKGAVATILLLKTNQEWSLSYHLLCAFKVFIILFAFLYLKANSKEIWEMTFPFFFSEKC